jgi:hypothetical protein
VRVFIGDSIFVLILKNVHSKPAGIYGLFSGTVRAGELIFYCLTASRRCNRGEAAS